MILDSFHLARLENYLHMSDNTHVLYSGKWSQWLHERSIGNKPSRAHDCTSSVVVTCPQFCT
eukprot:3172137-Amphidinium_carterae.1